MSAGWNQLVACALLCIGICLSIAVAAPHESSSIACPKGDFLCREGHCIRSSKICDGVSDCRNGEDEKYCYAAALSPITLNCTENEFRCFDNKYCILKSWMCDGEADCIDGSDEVFVCSPRTSCHDGFMCKNKDCIPLEFRCDGDLDCDDGSDEEGCVRASEVVPVLVSECSTSSHLYPCADDASYVKISKVCDDKVHCLDGSDEGGQCSDTKQCEHINCPNACYRTPKGPVCACPRGMEMVNHTCVDMDECNHYGICDQRCENLDGSYRCYCDAGYTLQGDKRTCKVEGGEAIMVIGAGSSIELYYLSSGNFFRIAKKKGGVAGVGFDGNHIYWTNIAKGEESIMRCDKDGSNTQVVLTAGLGLPEDLAVDWITRNIYFSDSELKHIGVCTSDGVSCTVLVNENVDKPRSIALNPTLKSMYWSDWGGKPLIAAAGMDGSNPVALVQTDIVWPNGLSVDYHNDRIYWVDAKRQKIESIKLDGSDRRVVLEHGLKNPFDIAVFEDMLYWSDLHGQQIQSCNKFTGNNHSTIIHEPMSRVFGVHIFHSSMQHSNISNPCVASACGHMCLLAPNPLGYSCACSGDGILASDRRTCLSRRNN